MQQFVESAVLGVGPGIVGQQALGDDPALEEPVQGAFGECGDRGGTFVVMDLGVGQPGTVVDDHVDVLPAGAGRVAGAVAGDGVAGYLKARVAFGIHVQQLARARPLIALHRVPGRAGTARAAASSQRPRHGRVRNVDLARDQTRAPPGPLADLADAVVIGHREHRRAAVRPRRAILQTGQRPPLLVAGRAPARHPAVHGRARHVRGGSCRRERETVLFDEPNQAQPAGPSERSITVFHPGLR